MKATRVVDTTIRNEDWCRVLSVRRLPSSSSAGAGVSCTPPPRGGVESDTTCPSSSSADAAVACTKPPRGDVESDTTLAFDGTANCRLRRLPLVLSPPPTATTDDVAEPKHSSTTRDFILAQCSFDGSVVVTDEY